MKPYDKQRGQQQPGRHPQNPGAGQREFKDRRNSISFFEPENKEKDNFSNPASKSSPLKK